MEEAQKKLSLAVNMLLGSLLLGVPRVALEFDDIIKMLPSNFPFNPTVFILTSQAVSMLITGFFIWKISQKKNWARILTLVITLLGLYGALSQVVEAIKYSPVSALIGLLQIFLNIGGLALIFMEPAAKCFRAVVVQDEFIKNLQEEYEEEEVEK